MASAGSAEKVAFLKDQLKVDYAFNYREGEPREHLKQGAYNGIDVYFDNTGGPQLEAALSALRERGRIAHVRSDCRLLHAGAGAQESGSGHREAAADWRASLFRTISKICRSFWLRPHRR